MSNPANSLAGLLHDARNMVSAIDLYCDLLEEPGVLSYPFRHFGGELRLVAGASRRLLEKLSFVECTTGLQLAGGPQSPSVPRLRTPQALNRPSTLPTLPLESPSAPIAFPERASDAKQGRLSASSRRRPFLEGEPVDSLAEELQANRNLLSALVGPGVTLGISLSGGNHPVAMTRDDLTRVLVNLARNAAEAMPGGGHVQIDLEEEAEHLSLSFADSGPGIPEPALEAIFSPGYTTRIRLDSGPDFERIPSPPAESPAWPVQHRGLGLSIVRSIVSATGGSVWAFNQPGDSPPSHRGQPVPDEAGGRASSEGPPCRGAVIRIEFPLFQSSMAP